MNSAMMKNLLDKKDAQIAELQYLSAAYRKKLVENRTEKIFNKICEIENKIVKIQAEMSELLASKEEYSAD